MKRIKLFIPVLIMLLCLSGCFANPTTDPSASEGGDHSVAENTETEGTASASDKEETSEASGTQKEDSESAEEESVSVNYVSYGKLEFNTVDINGDPVSMDNFKDADLIMINFWEPWCGPCVSEMPDLNLLYENYKDEGLLIVGVYHTTDMKDEAIGIIEELGITYPVIEGNSDFSDFTTDYVPTTIFIDKNGDMITPEPVIGANSYDVWENKIQFYLDRVKGLK